MTVVRSCTTLTTQFTGDFIMHLQRFRLILTKPVLIAVLLLMFTRGFARAQEAPALQFVQWSEPTANLFTAELPDGWSVNAGVVDVLGQPIPNVVAASPDQTAAVIAGLNQPYVFALPDATQGLTEGSSFSYGNVSVVVRPEQTPAAFLEEYLNAMLIGTTCEQISFQPLNTQQGNDPNYVSGEVTLTCTYPGNQATGYFYLGIYRLQLEFGQVWIPGDLFGYLAEPGREADAEAAMARLAQTLTVNPAAIPQTNPTMQSDPGMMGDPTMQGDPNAMTDEMSNLMDEMNAAALNNQVDQMMQSHMYSMMQNQFYWNCINTVTIMGGNYDSCG
jgi:hypothetical protein